MPLFPFTIRAAAILAVLLLGACNAPAPPSGQGRDDTIAAPSGLADDGHGDGYEYRIRYPELPPEWDVLKRALRDYASQRKRALQAGVPSERAANAAPAVLDLEFTIARRTDDFISVLAQGSVHTGNGGAPLASSFVLHTGDNRLLAIGDLFADPGAALNRLSSECGRQLQGRYEASLRQSVDARALPAALAAMQAGVEHGTAPAPENFAVYLVDGIDSKAIGLTLFFAQAQLAMNGGGEQQVEVPAKVFYDLLKPEYRDAFSVDLKEIAPGVR